MVIKYVHTNIIAKNIGLLTVVYAEDPEGNFIEIQNWKKLL